MKVDSTRRPLRDTDKLNFNCNLSFEERAVLENLSKHRDIIFKVTNKSSALVVWWADFYQKKLCSNFVTSQLTMYAKVNKDFTSTNQLIVKSTINDLYSQTRIAGYCY